MRSVALEINSLDETQSTAASIRPTFHAREPSNKSFYVPGPHCIQISLSCLALASEERDLEPSALRARDPASLSQASTLYDLNGHVAEAAESRARYHE